MHIIRVYIHTYVYVMLIYVTNAQTSQSLVTHDLFVFWISLNVISWQTNVYCNAYVGGTHIGTIYYYSAVIREHDFEIQ